MCRRSIRTAGLAFAALALVACHDTATAPDAVPDARTSAVAANTWITRANLPSTERVGITAAFVQGPGNRSILYAIGGRTSNTGGSLGKVQAYDVRANTWSYKASLPIPVYSTNGAGVIGGRIYVSGGETRDKFYRREFYAYDPASDIWTRKSDMPDDTWGGITGVLDGKLYVLTCSAEPECYLDYAPLELYRYDPVTDEWEFLSLSPRLYGRPMGGSIGGKLYVAGGGPSDTATLYAYDPLTGQWTPRASLARPRYGGDGVALGGRLYLLGGFERDPDGSVEWTRKVSIYNPSTDTWTSGAEVPTEVRDYAAVRVLVNGQPRIEVLGGPRPGNNLQYIP